MIWTHWDHESQSTVPAFILTDAMKWAALSGPFSLAPSPDGPHGSFIVLDKHGVHCFGWKRYGWPEEQARSIVERCHTAAAKYWMLAP